MEINDLIGQRVRVKLIEGEGEASILEGHVFSYDPKLNILILVESSHHTTLKRSFRLVDTTLIKEFFVLSAKDHPPAFSLKDNLPSVDLQRIRSKETTLIHSLQEEASFIGVGVSREAQELFNALRKMYPCKWQEKTIVIAEELSIPPPYDNVQGGNPVMAERVRKVVCVL